jgi:NADPH:quinone reductase-like Zn-dependent oxidoreductase
MKAAVIYAKGELPQYVDFPDPVVQEDDEVLVTVKAVAIKHFDKARAAGKHYSTDHGKIAGGDGICVLADGTRVFAMGVSGMLAEKAIVRKPTIVKIPDAVDDATAAALPNAVIGAAMALRFKAAITPGDVVLINGATGFTGRVAVQIAKYYGAKKVIATGRNQQSLNELLSLGADEIIPINDAFTIPSSIDIVLDYLWGTTAEVILNCIKGDGSFTNKIRYVSIGSMSGDLIQLSAAILRSVDLQLTGSGLGAWQKQEIGELFHHILPEMFELAAARKLVVNTTTVNIQDIAGLWQLDVPGGQRLVVTV